MPIPLGVLAVAGAGAAGGGLAYDLLESTVLGSDTASVTFSSLGAYSAYKHLQLRTVIRGTRAASVADVFIRLNDDSAGNYSYHLLRGNGSSVSSDAYPNSSNVLVAYATGSTFTANGFASTVIDILDFSNTSKNTTTRSLMGLAGTNNQIILASSAWRNTAAVTSIRLAPESGNFVTGSRFSLYGIK